MVWGIFTAIRTISSDRQIEVPKALRNQLGLEDGAELEMDVVGESLVLKRAAGEVADWRKMRGIARGGESLTKALEEERTAERAHDEARIKGY